MELEVNGIKADLGNATPAITRKSFDIENPQDRFIDITNRFVLPYTPVNNEIFNSPLAVNSSNDSFDKFYTVKYIDQFIIFNGYGILTGGNRRKGYELQIIDKSTDVFAYLDALLTAKLWDDYDIYLTTTSRNTVDNESIDHPIVWPHICYHKKKISSKTSLTDLKYSRPCIYLPGLLNLRLSDIGYSFTSTKKLALTLNHENFFFTSYQKIITGTVNDGNNFSNLNVDDFSTYVTVGSTTIDVLGLQSKFRLRGTIEASADLVITISAYDSVAGTTEVQKFNISSEDTEIDIETGELQSENNTLSYSFAVSGGDLTMTACYLYSLHPEKDVTNLDTNPFSGFLIKVQDNLPDITFKDIYKTMCISENSTHIIDTLDRIFELRSFANINKLNSLDWSDRFIQETDDISGTFSNLAKKNWLRYDNDETVPKYLGRSYFEVNNDTLQDEKDYIVFPFSASEQTEISGNEIVSINMYEDTMRISDQTINIRLIEVDSGYSSFSNLDWNNLKLEFEGLFNSLYRIRAINCKMSLNKLDVLGWDLVQLVYIDYYSAYFIVNEISDFVSNTLTDVKLLKYG